MTISQCRFFSWCRGVCNNEYQYRNKKEEPANGSKPWYDKKRKRWRILYTDNNGDRKPVYGKTLQEVIDNHREIQRALKYGTYIKKMPDTFNQIMDTMLDEQEANRELKPGSMLRKRRTATLISETSFAKKAIQKIQADEIKSELKKFANLKKPNGESKYSQSYLDKIFSVTREVFFYAVDNEKLTLEQSPFKTKTKIKRPKAGKKPRKVTSLDIDETKAFLRQLTIETDKYKDELWFITLTGVRPGECLGIRNKQCKMKERNNQIKRFLNKGRER